MSSGYGANFALVLDQEKLEELQVGSYMNFVQALKEKNVSLESYAQSTENSDVVYNEDNEELSQEDTDALDRLFEWFQEEFKQQKGVGINIGYHDVSGSGDCYDDVDGAFFSLNFGDVYQMTPEAQELEKKTEFEMKFFVSFG